MTNWTLTFRTTDNPTVRSRTFATWSDMMEFSIQPKVTIINVVTW